MFPDVHADDAHQVNSGAFVQQLVNMAVLFDLVLLSAYQVRLCSLTLHNIHHTVPVQTHKKIHLPAY